MKKVYDLLALKVSSDEDNLRQRIECGESWKQVLREHFIRSQAEETFQLGVGIDVFPVCWISTMLFSSRKKSKVDQKRVFYLLRKLKLITYSFNVKRISGLVIPLMVQCNVMSFPSWLWSVSIAVKKCWFCMNRLVIST